MGKARETIDQILCRAKTNYAKHRLLLLLLLKMLILMSCFESFFLRWDFMRVNFKIIMCGCCVMCVHVCGCVVAHMCVHTCVWVSALVARSNRTRRKTLHSSAESRCNRIGKGVLHTKQLSENKIEYSIPALRHIRENTIPTPYLVSATLWNEWIIKYHSSFKLLLLFVYACH